MLEQAERVARGFVKKRQQQNNLGFVDEAEAEAVFIVTYLIYSEYDGIMAKYPDKEERHKFYRMTVGFKLREYFSYRPTSTVSYLKKKGIEVKRHAIHEDMRVTYVSPMDVQIVLEDLCPNELHIRVLEFYSMGNDYDEIAVKCGLTAKRVKRIVNHVRRQLSYPLI